MKHLALTLSLLCLALAGCSNGISNSTPPSPTSPPVTGATYVFTDNLNANLAGQILAFSATSTGAATPVATLTGANNNGFSYLTGDVNGNLYAFSNVVYSSNGITVHVYSTPAGMPTQTRSFTSTALTAPGYLAADKSGNVYVSQTGKTLVFASTASGASSPTVTLGGYSGAMATDTAGSLYIASGTNIYVFASGFTASSTPTRTINAAASVSSLQSVAVDTSGNIYTLGYTASNVPTILVYASTASGAATPTRTITGSSTKMVAPDSIAVDAKGTLYVDDFTGGYTGTGLYLEFASTANGNVAPSSSFTAAAVTYPSSGIAIY